VIAPAGGVVPLLPRTGAPAAVLNAAVGVPFILPIAETSQLITGGVAPFTASVAPGSVLPPGLTLLAGGNGLSPILGGTPTLAGSYSYSLLINDAASQSLTVPVAQIVSSIVISPDSLLPGVVGTP